jgi:uncharacterized membrane protein YeaQ/YmgE (transglycosylase-associated protein family)
MEGVGWIAAIIIGGIAGWIAEKVMHAEHGLLVNIILGIVGAVVLNFILMLVFGGTLGGWFGQLIVGALGAMLLIWVYRLIRRRCQAVRPRPHRLTSPSRLQGRRSRKAGGAFLRGGHALGALEAAARRRDISRGQIGLS